MCVFRVRVLKSHQDRAMRPRQPLRVAHAQSGPLAQQNLFVPRNSSTLKVCATLPNFFCLLSSHLNRSLYDVHIRKHREI